MKTLVLGLGNDLLSDDAIGVIAAGELRENVEEQIDVVACNSAGLALLDMLVGYDKVIIIDSIHSGNHPPGTIIEMTIEDLRSIPGTSPHYAGLPEVVSIGKKLGFAMPDELLIMAVEISERLTIGGKLSKSVASSLEDLIKRIKNRIQGWKLSITGLK